MREHQAFAYLITVLYKLPTQSPNNVEAKEIVTFAGRWFFYVLQKIQKKARTERERTTCSALL
jgi:hypothetical protein